MKEIHIVRGRYTLSNVSVYFDIEFFDSYEKAEQYRKARRKAQCSLGEIDVEYYIYTTSVY